jgi:hypothetical protein
MFGSIVFVVLTVISLTSFSSKIKGPNTSAGYPSVSYEEF